MVAVLQLKREVYLTVELGIADIDQEVAGLEGAGLRLDEAVLLLPLRVAGDGAGAGGNLNRV